MLILIAQVTLLVFWIKKHNEDGLDALAALLVMALMGAGVIAWLWPGDHQKLMPALALFLCAPGLFAFVVFWRHSARVGGDVPPVRCDYCGASADLLPLVQFRVTGLLVWMYLYEDGLHVCSGCVPRQVAKSALHNLTLGWWWLPSALAVPGLVLLNGMLGVRARVAGLEDAQRHVAQVLAPHDDYISAMVATKDEDTVVEVMSEKTGLRTSDVRGYLRAREAEKLPTATARSKRS